MKGALVAFTPAFGGAVPNVIVFQFNPETLRRSWTQPESSRRGGDPLAVAGMPGESYSLTLLLNSTDVVVDDPTSPAARDAVVGGLASRLAALEMLLFPVPDAGDAAAAAAAAVSAPTGPGSNRKSGSPRATPTARMPAVLFVWGPGRILPVRITSLSITENQFNARLHPTHATVELGFRVMTPKELDNVTGPFTGIAHAAYEYSQNQRAVLALANLQRVEDVVDLPPIPRI